MLKRYRFPFTAMASRCEIQIYGTSESEAERVSNLAVADVHRIERRYSRYRDDSELSRINRVALTGGRTKVDEETAGLLNYANTCYEQSDGLFDISSGVLRKAWDFESGNIPQQCDIDPLLKRIGWDKVRWRQPIIEFIAPGMELDFGGIGKEYAVDRAATICREQGIENGLVDLGGDIMIVGPHADGRPWSVGVRHPTKPGQLMASINVYRGGVASSGDYERCIVVDGQRFGHILNPKTGWPVSGLISVTVLSDQCIVAGSASTVALLKGDEGNTWLAELGVPHLWMDQDGKIGGILDDQTERTE